MFWYFQYLIDVFFWISFVSLTISLHFRAHFCFSCLIFCDLIETVGKTVIYSSCRGLTLFWPTWRTVAFGMRTQTVLAKRYVDSTPRDYSRYYSSKWIGLSGMRGSANASCLCNIARYTKLAPHLAGSHSQSVCVWNVCGTQEWCGSWTVTRPRGRFSSCLGSSSCGCEVVNAKINKHTHTPTRL